MVDATDPDANGPNPPPTGGQPDTVPARLARCAGEGSRERHGWTWRGRLPAEAVADLLRRALTSTPLSFEGPVGAPSRVWLRAVWFDAGHGSVTCELVAGDAAEGRPTARDASDGLAPEPTGGAPAGGRVQGSSGKGT